MSSDLSVVYVCRPWLAIVFILSDDDFEIKSKYQFHYTVVSSCFHLYGLGFQDDILRNMFHFIFFKLSAGCGF